MEKYVRAPIAPLHEFVLAAFWLCILANGGMLLFSQPPRPDLFAHGLFLAVMGAFIFGGKNAEMAERRGYDRMPPNTFKKILLGFWRARRLIEVFLRGSGLLLLLISLGYLAAGLDYFFQGANHG